MTHLFKISALILIGASALLACTPPLDVEPPSATHQATALPSATPTLTPTPAPTNTPAPTPTDAPCNKDAILLKLRSLALKDEIVFNHSSLNNIPSLNVWFVAREIDPAVSPENLVENNRLTQHAAAELVIRIVNSERCIAKLFSYVSPVVVDRQYHGYFSAQVSPLIIPKTDSPTEEDIQAVMAAFINSYIKTAAPPSAPPAPVGSCSWPETEARIRQHFSSERPNVSFYYVIDEYGANVWAQWDGPFDELIVLTNLLNITQELDCLHPRPDNLIYIVVDEAGNVGVVNIWPIEK